LRDQTELHIEKFVVIHQYIRHEAENEDEEDRCQAPPSHPGRLAQFLPHDHHGRLMRAVAENCKQIHDVEVVLRDDTMSCKPNNQYRHSGDELLVAERESKLLDCVSREWSIGFQERWQPTFDVSPAPSLERPGFVDDARIQFMALAIIEGLDEEERDEDKQIRGPRRQQKG
jgi:hypothetical protein